MNKEVMIVECGKRKWIMDAKWLIKLPTIWVEEICNMMNKRNLEVVNQTIDRLFLTDNKTIIEYAEQYIVKKELENSVCDRINYVWLHKEMIIPAELVGVRGRERMEAFTNIEKKSLLN